MSELKARKFFEAIPTSKEGFYQPCAFVDGYLKTEADKVIAELEADKLELKQRLNVLDGKLFGLSQSYNIKISMYGCLERKIKEKDKVIADLEESHKKEVKQLLMEIVELKENHKKEVEQLLMKIAGLEKLVETADKFVKQTGGFTVKDITLDGVKLEGMKND